MSPFVLHSSPCRREFDLSSAAGSDCRVGEPHLTLMFAGQDKATWPEVGLTEPEDELSADRRSSQQLGN